MSNEFLNLGPKTSFSTFSGFSDEPEDICIDFSPVDFDVLGVVQPSQKSDSNTTPPNKNFRNLLSKSTCALRNNLKNQQKVKKNQKKVKKNQNSQKKVKIKSKKAQKSV